MKFFILYIIVVLFAPLAVKAEGARYSYQGIVGTYSDPVAEYNTIPMTIDLNSYVIKTFDVIEFGKNCILNSLSFCINSPSLKFSMPKKKLEVGEKWSLFFDDSEILFEVRNRIRLHLIGIDEVVYVIDSMNISENSKVEQRFYFSETKGLLMFSSFGAPDILYWSSNQVGIAIDTEE
ncbi:hypothetical protein JK628_17795 [Shewanella sp. KX20019]|uniref:hypothetical protein n=1 Tax=Shewanella sp. KX20019 TaxID=2803864 RepID=UPI001926D402|nr:hypothetical protein [Shewanella sp. KX20019]QQX79368.1 hypothetical protein JK628_17795 [Shewanella sp. KX20019]